MHQLDRTHTPAPAGLNRYAFGVNDWNDLTVNDRQEIRAALELMQTRRCAYCECDLDIFEPHIEHFRQRSRYPQGTFEWDNLFWSCQRTDSCGKFKDSCGPYNHEDLIKPDVEDPEHFFLFITSGAIKLRTGLTAGEQHRANETLRIFNLDEQWGPLRKMRQIAVSGYLRTLEDLQELRAVFSPEEIEAHINSEFDYTRRLPFCTAIKHALTL